mgnify:CR=1 FL=1
MDVFLSRLAESKLIELSRYLLENWSLKTRNEFLSKFTDKVKQISSQPESCPKSFEFKGLYQCVVTKQTTFYYRILNESDEIEIITIFDTRQDPDKLKNRIN